jgi:hypothetical protein
MDTSLDDLIQEMDHLEQQMRKFEWKYSIKWPEFYKLVQSGKIEETFEFHEWLGLIKLWLSRRKEYLQLLKKPSPLIRLEKPLEADFFEKVESVL